MNTIFASTTVVVLSFLLWTLGKRPSKKNYEEILSNRKQDQTTLVQPSQISKKNRLQATESLTKENLPLSSRERINLAIQLKQSMKRGPAERLEAIEIAANWGHKCTLPLLKLGLKDSDSRVVEIAARALGQKKFQFCEKKSQLVRPPRNVALMR